jgi:hypothetical protein
MTRLMATTVLSVIAFGAAAVPALAQDGDNRGSSRRPDYRHDDRDSRSDDRYDRDHPGSGSGVWDRDGARRRTLLGEVQSLRWRAERLYRSGRLTRYRRDHVISRLDGVQNTVRRAQRIDDYYYRSTLRRLEGIEDSIRAAADSDDRGGSGWRPGFNSGRR